MILNDRHIDKEYLDELYKYTNKAYGGYVIKLGYRTRMIRSLIFVISLCFLLISVYYIFRVTDIQDEFVLPYDIAEVILSDYEQLQAPPKQQEPPPKAQQLTSVVQPTIEPEQQVVKQEKKTEEIKLDKKIQDTIVSNSAATGILKGDTAGKGMGLTIVIDHYPEFPGGDKARSDFFRSKIRYPINLKHIKGVVKVYFNVEIDGSITNIKIIQSLHPNLDNEVIRAVRLMPKWKPAYRQGKPVRLECTLPFRF